LPQDIVVVIARVHQRFPAAAFGHRPAIRAGEVPAWTFAPQNGEPAIRLLSADGFCPLTVATEGRGQLAPLVARSVNEAVAAVADFLRGPQG
jgi:hypothetical protein